MTDELFNQTIISHRSRNGDMLVPDPLSHQLALSPPYKVLSDFVLLGAQASHDQKGRGDKGLVLWALLYSRLL